MNPQVFYDATSTSSISGGGSSSVLGNLPSIKEAREAFLYYLCRCGPDNNTESGILYKTLLMRNVDAKANFLVLELQGLVSADNASTQRGLNQNEDTNNEPTNLSENLSRLAPLITQGALGRLYVALRRKPLWFIRDLEEVCHLLLKDEFKESLYTKDREVPQIQLLLQGQDIRPLDIRELTVRFQEQFVVVPGIIIQASVPQPKLSVAALQCRYCDHRHFIKLPPTKDKLVMPRMCLYALAMNQKGRGSQTMEEELGDPSRLGCLNAKNPYIILTNESTFVDTQSMKLQEHPEAVPVGDVPRSLMLNAFGYNCGVLRPGERVLIHGVLSSYNPQGDVYDGQNLPYVQVLRYQKTSDDHQSQETNFSVEEQIEFARMAQTNDIYEKIFNSIAPALFGLDDVKKAIACVLFGGVQKEHVDSNLHRGDINMLMLGDPSVAKSQMLKFAARAANLSVYSSGKGSSAAGLTASVVRDKNGIFALEGGAMVLADGGVVCIDEFDKMREEDIVAMHEAMEQQTISINKAGISTMLNSRCSVIAAANPSFGSYDDTVDSTEQHEMKATILSRFDVIFMLRDKENVEKDDQLCRHIMHLQEGGNQEVKEGEIPLQTLRRYIVYAKETCSPVLTASAAAKLRTFYVQTRSMARNDKRSSTRKIPITIRQLESLYRLSESFAKMQLSSEATEQHVEMAIQVFTASTVETAKHTLVFESMTPHQQKQVQLAEEAVLNRVQPGARVPRNALIKDLQHKGFEKSSITRAFAILVKQGTLQERADRSLRRR